MFGLIGAIISAAVAGGTAIAKGVQARRQRREREAQQGEMSQAMEQASEDTEMNRRRQKEMTMQSAKYQVQQMAPIQSAMQTAYGSVGYEPPDMSWIMNYGEDPRQNVSQGRPVNGKSKTGPGTGVGKDTSVGGSTPTTYGDKKRGDLTQF